MTDALLRFALAVSALGNAALIVLVLRQWRRSLPPLRRDDAMQQVIGDAPRWTA